MIDEPTIILLEVIFVVSYVGLDYTNDFPTPLGEFFPEIDLEFYLRVQSRIKGTPWAIFLELVDKEKEEGHPLFLEFVLNSFEDLDEKREEVIRISLLNVGMVANNYWEEIFPEKMKLLPYGQTP